MTSTFNDLGLSEKLLLAVDVLGYATPTPVQEQAIPIVLTGADVAAAAKTGTGKTAAFSFPMMQRIAPGKGKRNPRIVVLSPTRELADQTYEIVSSIASVTKHKAALVVGGVAYSPQIKRIAAGIDVLVATPGRLQDLVNQEAVNLSHTEILVFDEADRMLDMGFLPDIKKLVAEMPGTKDRQTMLFSATLDRALMDQVGYMLDNPVYVEISHKGDIADKIDQWGIQTTQYEKPALLEVVLGDLVEGRAIVFARTKHRCDNVARRLQRKGYRVEAIHAGRSQAQRRHALEAFSQGNVDVLVATDVLARGIDIEQVEYVINYDLPMVPDDYIHRIGRTGRAGAEGNAVSFITKESRKYLKDIQKLLGKDIPLRSFEWSDDVEAEADRLEKLRRPAAAKRKEQEAQQDAGTHQQNKKSRSHQQRSKNKKSQKSQVKERKGDSQRNKKNAHTSHRPGDNARKRRAKDVRREVERSKRKYSDDAYAEQKGNGSKKRSNSDRRKDNSRRASKSARNSRSARSQRRKAR